MMNLLQVQNHNRNPERLLVEQTKAALQNNNRQRISLAIIAIIDNSLQPSSLVAKKPEGFALQTRFAKP